MSGANALDARTDFARLGPATQTAIRTGDLALKQEIAQLEQKLRIRSLTSLERSYYQRELDGTRAALTQLWSQPYPEPYEPASRNARPPDREGDDAQG